jgi:hypothetical protein
MRSGLGGLSDPTQTALWSFKNVPSLVACMTITESTVLTEAGRAEVPNGTITVTFTDPINPIIGDVVRNPSANITATLNITGGLITTPAPAEVLGAISITSDHVISIPYNDLRNDRTFTLVLNGTGTGAATATVAGVSVAGVNFANTIQDR